MATLNDLPRREREVFETLCGLGEGTSAAVRAAMASPPSDSATRTLLSRLEGRGLVTHRVQNQAYVYAPALEPADVRASALQQLVRTFFDGSAASAASALLGTAGPLKPEEIEALSRAIEDAKRRTET